MSEENTGDLKTNNFMEKETTKENTAVWLHERFSKT